MRLAWLMREACRVPAPFFYVEGVATARGAFLPPKYRLQGRRDHGLASRPGATVA